MRGDIPIHTLEDFQTTSTLALLVVSRVSVLLLLLLLLLQYFSRFQGIRAILGHQSFSFSQFMPKEHYLGNKSFWIMSLQGSLQGEPFLSAFLESLSGEPFLCPFRLNSLSVLFFLYPLSRGNEKLYCLERVHVVENQELTQIFKKCMHIVLRFFKNEKNVNLKHDSYRVFHLRMCFFKGLKMPDNQHVDKKKRHWHIHKASPFDSQQLE